MAAATDGKIYAIGGQLTAEGGERAGYVDTVYELDPAIGQWVAKAPMPTARSAGVAVVLDGKIYVAGGRPPRGHDFAVKAAMARPTEERAAAAEHRSPRVLP
jgi:N-acetylneuraminic acid mutarotase